MIELMEKRPLLSFTYIVFCKLIIYLFYFDCTHKFCLRVEVCYISRHAKSQYFISWYSWFSFNRSTAVNDNFDVLYYV